MLCDPFVGQSPGASSDLSGHKWPPNEAESAPLIPWSLPVLCVTLWVSALEMGQSFSQTRATQNKDPVISA